MSDKSVRELELIIQRLNSQIESKNEQIAELNAFIQTATANTQELIRSFRAFCVKVLESELAYGDITSRDLEMMSLEELLGRSRKMLKQNQEKARSIYDTFKDRLTQKNLMIQGLTDQVSQLKTKLDQRNDEPFEVPDDLKRTQAYLLETDTPLDAIRPAISNTTIAGENERVVSFDEGETKSTGDGVTQAKLYVQNFNSITEQMKDIHWEVFRLLVESGVSELSRAKMMITEKLRDNDEVIGPEKAARLIRQLTTLLLFDEKVEIAGHPVIFCTECCHECTVMSLRKLRHMYILRLHIDLRNKLFIKPAVTAEMICRSRIVFVDAENLDISE